MSFTFDHIVAAHEQ